MEFIFLILEFNFIFKKHGVPVKTFIPIITNKNIDTFS